MKQNYRKQNKQTDQKALQGGALKVQTLSK